MKPFTLLIPSRPIIVHGVTFTEHQGRCVMAIRMEIDARLFEPTFFGLTIDELRSQLSLWFGITLPQFEDLFAAAHAAALDPPHAGRLSNN